MINDFYSDSSCFAHFQFEEGYLTEDSQKTNTLTNLGVTSSTSASNYHEGYGAALFNGSSYFEVLDSALCTDFPLKWVADPALRQWTPNIISFCFWVKPLDVSGDQTLIAKDNGADKRCFQLMTSNGSLQLLWGFSGTGTAALTINTGLTFSANNWYHVGVTIVGPNAFALIRVWNDTTQAVVCSHQELSLGTDIATNDSPITIGAGYGGSTPLNGILDELVIFNEARKSVEFDAIRQEIYAGPLQNSFVDDPTCKALYRFESDGILKDSISTNHLTDFNTVRDSSAVGLYMEGKQSVYFDSTYLEYALITDANLTSDFPLRSTDTTKEFSVCFWFRCDAVSGTSYFVSKTSSTSGQKSFAVYRANASLRVTWGYSSGTQSETITIGDVTSHRWYHVGIALNGGSQPYLIYRVWDSVARDVIYYNKIYPTYSISVGSAPFMLGATYPASSFHKGYLDEVVVFSSAKTLTEIDLIREGAFQRQLVPMYVATSGVAVQYFRQPEHLVGAFGTHYAAADITGWKVSGSGVMALVRKRLRTTMNQFWLDPNCIACYSFEPDPGFLVDHVGGNDLTDHNTVEPVQ